MKIQRAAGHSDAKTTQRYIEEAEVFDLDSFGRVFPELPAGLAQAAKPIGPQSGNWAMKAGHLAEIMRERQRPYLEEFRTALISLEAA